MFYLSIAIVIVAIIFTIKPPQLTFNLNKIITVRQNGLDTHMPMEAEAEPPEVKKLMEDSQPTLDDLVATLNETIYDITGGDN